MNQMMTCQEFNRQVSRAQRQCEESPVFITNRGKLAYVLLNYDDYQKLNEKDQSIAEALAAPENEALEVDIEFERAYIESREFQG
ncbi:type II toxin-antitoxin system Phd/YefM family antitoxin [Stenoxybacter acetivorans]|uniref:type II toxin-antitoxin system Phd/YefM family antitoxin n=1 Tax=Stenoxybacter acetivorans TaxID=422441 RepID=UPI00055C685F|nr:type II toxin-antitoxin system Phd/YefM family antitoxin [Stenoxybacter acetivorans]